MGVRHPATVSGMGNFFPTFCIRQMMFLDLFFCKTNMEYSEKCPIVPLNLQRPRSTSLGR